MKQQFQITCRSTAPTVPDLKSESEVKSDPPRYVSGQRRPHLCEHGGPVSCEQCHHAYRPWVSSPCSFFWGRETGPATLRVRNLSHTLEDS